MPVEGRARALCPSNRRGAFFTGTWGEGDKRGRGRGEERPVVPSRVQAGRKETGDPSAKSPKQQREN